MKRLIINKYTLIIAIMIGIVGCEDEITFSDFESRQFNVSPVICIEHINPETGENYTQEELAELSYDPCKEVIFFDVSAGSVELTFVSDIKPLRVEVENAGDYTNYATLTDIVEEGGQYKVTFTANFANLGVEAIGDSAAILFNGFYDLKESSGELVAFSTVFSIKYAALPVTGDDLPALVGPLASSVVGLWEFDDPSNLGKATIGTQLELTGTDAAVDGPIAEDGATEVGVGSGYKVVHNMPATGGTRVNTFSLVYDVKLPAIGAWINILQSNHTNGGDGTTYVTSGGQLWSPGTGATGSTLQADTWYRLVITNDAGEYKVYVNGNEELSFSAGTDNERYSFDVSNFFVFLDDNGEDDTIQCSNLVLLDEVLTPSQVASIANVNEPAYKNVKEDIVGRWKFDDPSNLGKATIGTQLELTGTDAAVDGPIAEDGATEVGVGSGYKVVHNMPATGGTRVNTFSLVYDVKLPAIGAWINILQSNHTNGGDGTTYVTSGGQLWSPGTGATGSTLQADTWYRLVITNDAGEYKVYVNGNEELSFSAGTDNERYSFDVSNFFVFLDDNGEDDTIQCSDLILLQSVLSAEDVAALPPIGTPVF